MYHTSSFHPTSHSSHHTLNSDPFFLKKCISYIVHIIIPAIMWRMGTWAILISSRDRSKNTTMMMIVMCVGDFRKWYGIIFLFETCNVVICIYPDVVFSPFLICFTHSALIFSWEATQKRYRFFFLLSVCVCVCVCKCVKMFKFQKIEVNNSLTKGVWGVIIIIIVLPILDLDNLVNNCVYGEY